MKNEFDGELVDIFSDENIFLGEKTYKIDAKGRMNFPAKFREKLEKGGFIICRWIKCLVIYPKLEWRKLISDILSQPEDDNVINYKRWLLSKSEVGRFDNQGRLLISNSLRKSVGIEKVAHLVGQGHYLELWNLDKWNEINEEITRRADREGMSYFKKKEN